MKTKKMVAVIGTYPGYGHNNMSTGRKINFCSLYMEIASEVFAECGIYVTAVCSETRTLYNTAWGCPKDGEVTYKVEATANPSFVQDMDAWKQACIQLIKMLKEKLKQSTVTVEFFDVELIYIK